MKQEQIAVFERILNGHDGAVNLMEKIMQPRQQNSKGAAAQQRRHGDAFSIRQRSN